MRIIHNIRSFRRLEDGVFLAVGFFDGVHRGHRKVIEQAVATAARKGGKTWVLTFDPHPARILRPAESPPLLTSQEHKLRLLARLKLDGVLVLPFTPLLGALSPSAFIDYLLERVPTLAEIFVGRNWRFGQHGKGHTRLLSSLGRSRHFGVTIVSPVTRLSQTISSTRVRNEVLQGCLDEAAIMLGRPYSILGTVVKGRGVGRRLGYPTANLEVHNEVLPPNGVYAVRALINGVSHNGVLNLGSRPTFRGAAGRTTAVEVYLLDFSGRLYGRKIEIFFVERMRDQMAFRSPAKLARRIGEDAQQARKILSFEKPQKG